MRIAILICCILALALLALIGLSYIMGISSEVSVTGIDNGVIIQNVGNHPCLVIVNSPEGEQQFKLAVGANVTLVTLSDIAGTTYVSAFGSATVRVDLAGSPAEVSVTGIDNGVIIQNVGNVPCLVVVNSLEGEQQFELAVGANVTLVTLSHITTPINVLAFGSRTIPVDLEELEELEKARENWAKIKYNLS